MADTDNDGVDEVAPTNPGDQPAGGAQQQAGGDEPANQPPDTSQIERPAAAPLNPDVAPGAPGPNEAPAPGSPEDPVTHPENVGKVQDTDNDGQ